MAPLRIGWFATGRGAGSRELLDFICQAIADGRLDACIEFVFCNREPGEADGSDQFLRLAEGYSLPLVTLSSARYRREHGGGLMSRHRDGYDRRVLELLAGFRPDVCALAGYMLICSDALCRRYPLLNLHGALPDGPTGTWQSVIWQLIASGATQTGAMIHLATEEVDRGPALAHCALSITGGLFDADRDTVRGRDVSAIQAAEGECNPLFRRIRAEGSRREPHLLLAVLQAVAEGRLIVKPGAALDADGNPLSQTYPQGLPLTGEIEAAIAGE